MTGSLEGSVPPGAITAPRTTVVEGSSWLLLGAVALYVVGAAAWSGDVFPALNVALLLGLGSLLFRGTAAHLFRIAFAMNVIWVFLLAAHFTGARGVPFSAGGDDLLFFETSVDVGRSWANGNWGAHQRYGHFSCYGYILVGAALYVAALPFGEFGPLAIRIWGAFAGATIGPAIYLLARALTPDRGREFWTRAGLAAGLFPILTYYSAIGLRDVWLAAGATWVIATLTLARLERPGFLLGWVAPIVLLLLGSLFRPESVLALLAFWLGLHYARRHTVEARVASAVIVLGTVTLAVMFFETIVVQIVHQQMIYQYAVDEAGPGSLGARILQIPPPLGYLARFVYAVVTPVPPLTAVRPDTILIGVGATLWYFALPLAVAGFASISRRGPEQKAIVNGIAIFAGILLVGVALTSIDVRHKLPLIPVTVLLAAAALADHDRRWVLDRIVAVGLAGAALGGLYLVIKLA